MARYSLIIVGFILTLTSIHAKPEAPPRNRLPLWALMLDSKESGILPKRFRTTRDEISGSMNISGFHDLNISGSAQFSVAQLSNMIKKIKTFGFAPSQIIIVDLRGEPHAFVNSYPVMWYAQHAWWTFSDPVALVLANEQRYLDSLTIGQTITLNQIAKKDEHDQPEVIDVYNDQILSLNTEEQVVKAAGAYYLRIPVTDHMRPEDKDVDLFLIFVKNLSQGVWIHFHCHGGHGRTSTFMIMYDMLRNPSLSFDAVIDRQVKLGSLDMRKFENPGKPHKVSRNKDRFHFLKLFYQYIHDPKGYGQISWTKWVMQRGGKFNDKSDNNDAFASTAVATAAG